MRLWSLLTLQMIPGKLRLACFGSVGMLAGMGVYVALISNAVSYLSDDPKACINCHIMRPMFATWEKSSHGKIATCNDCHVPQDSVFRKYWFKANDGLRHSALFVLRRERQVIEAIPESKEVIQQNCIRCHAGTMDKVTMPKGHDFERSCIECHREVPHGRVKSLSSTPNAAVPPLSPVTPSWMKSDRD